MIKKIVNVINKNIKIEGITIKPKEYYIWHQEYFTESLLSKLKALENLNFIKVFTYEEDDSGYDNYMIDTNIQPYNLMDTISNTSAQETYNEEVLVEEAPKKSSKKTKKETSKDE